MKTLRAAETAGAGKGVTLLVDMIPQDDIPRKQCNGPCGRTLPATPEFFARNRQHKDGLQYLCKLCTKAYKEQHYQAHKEQLRAQNRLYAAAHKEQTAERSKRYVETHREHYLAYHKQYYQDRKEPTLGQMKQYYQVHSERIRKRVKRYRDANREQVIERERRYHTANREQLAERRRQQYKEHREHYLAQKKRDHEKHKEQHYASQKLYRKTERGRLIHRALWHKREARKKAIGGSYTAQQIQDLLKRQKRKCYYCHKRLEKYHVEHVIPLSRGGSNDISNIVIACPTCNMRKHDRLPHEWPEGGRLL